MVLIAALTLLIANSFFFNPKIVIRETWKSRLIENCGVESLDRAF